MDQLTFGVHLATPFHEKYLLYIFDKNNKNIFNMSLTYYSTKHVAIYTADEAAWRYEISQHFNYDDAGFPGGSILVTGFNKGALKLGCNAVLMCVCMI